MEKIELLAPAGNLEKAKTALEYGADAVYIGGQSFSLRSRASNFTLEQIEELCRFAHERNKRVHVTVNIIPHPDDFDGLDRYLQALDDAGVDAIITASAAIISQARALNPGYEIHLSTQRSAINSAAVSFWKRMGVDRVVTGRECGLDSLRSICRKNILPIEAFIHGGMCISYSGRCVLSNHMTLRDANRGGCAQSCRWKYRVFDEDGKQISLDSMPYSMSSKDLMGLDFVEDMMKMGIASLKIEGRMKSAYYLATVVSSYRRLIDHIAENGSADPAFKEAMKQEIAKAENRPTGPGFYRGIPGSEVQLYRDHDETVTQEYIGLVLGRKDENWIDVQVKNRFFAGDTAEIFGPDLENAVHPVAMIRSMQGDLMEVCRNPMECVRIYWPWPACTGAMLRKVPVSAPSDQSGTAAVQSGPKQENDSCQEDMKRKESSEAAGNKQ